MSLLFTVTLVSQPIMNPLQISTEENETMEVSIKIDIRGPSTSSTVSFSKKDENREREKEEEEEDHSKTVHVLAPEKLLLIELKALFAEFYPPLSPTCKVRIYTTKSKWPHGHKLQESRFIASYRVNTPSASSLQYLLTKIY